MAKKIKEPTYISFTFYAWAKSILVVALLVALFTNYNYTGVVVGKLLGPVVVLFAITTPLFLLMLLAVKMIHSSKLNIHQQKTYIYGSWLAMILFFDFIIFKSLGLQPDINIILIFLSTIVAPAIFIYREPYPASQPTIKPSTPNMDDVIDDINFND